VSQKRAQILERRAELQRRAEAQRNEIAAIFQPWEQPLEFVDRGVKLIRTVRRVAPLIGLVFGFTTLSSVVGGRRRSARRRRED